MRKGIVIKKVSPKKIQKQLTIGSRYDIIYIEKMRKERNLKTFPRNF